jgi:ADP-ribosylglycohydrolase
MRAPILGVALRSDTEKLGEFVSVCTRITHSDPKALAASLLVAYAAGVAAEQKRITPADFLDGLKLSSAVWRIPDDARRESIALMEATCRSVAIDESTPSFARALSLDRGIGGYIYETVPVVIHAWLSNQHNFEETITQIVLCGGDTDTTAAIAGALAGAQCGVVGIPESWLAGIRDWPRSTKWIERLAHASSESLKSNQSPGPPQLFFPALVVRNVLFVAIVLAHGLRRVFPPY